MRLFRLEFPLGPVIAGSALVVGLATPGAADRPSVKAPPHTRSIVACDPDRSQCGIAVVTFISGVGSKVAVGEPGVMVANQWWANYATARRIIEYVKAGEDAETALEKAINDDPDSDWRQIGVAALDPSSPSRVSVASWTGSGSVYLPEVCSQTGATYAVQAGLQTSPQVCAVMADAFQKTSGLLPRRLLKALLAGAAVGSDVRGEYSASVRVVSDTWDWAWFTPWVVAADVNRSGHWQADVELAVDTELAEWWTPGDTADLAVLTREKAREIQRVLRRLGYYCGPAHGTWTAQTEDALKAWELAQLGWEKPTVESGGKRYIEEAVAGYLILGWPRGVLVRNPAAGD